MAELGWLPGLGLQRRCLERRDKEKNTLSKKSMWTAQVYHSKTIVVTMHCRCLERCEKQKNNEDDQ